MIELELLGTSSDGESLVLTDAQGERYSILISDELRGAIRRDRPKVDITPSRPTLAPRDIQALLRAGATPEEIASTHGMDVKAVERFEAPVQVCDSERFIKRVTMLVDEQLSEYQKGFLDAAVVAKYAVRATKPYDKFAKLRMKL